MLYKWFCQFTLTSGIWDYPFPHVTFSLSMWSIFYFCQCNCFLNHFLKGISFLNCIFLIISTVEYLFMCVGHLYFLVDYVFLMCLKVHLSILDINLVSSLYTVDSHYLLCTHAQSLSRVQVFATPWTVACQAPLSTDFPGKNTVEGCHFLLQRMFPSQGSNLHFLLGRQILYHWATWEALESIY